MNTLELLKLTTNKTAPGLNNTKKAGSYDPWWWLVAAVVALIVTLVLIRPNPFMRILLYVRDGVWVTISVTLTSFVLILILGLIVALARLSRNRLIYGGMTVYVEVARGIPMLVQLLFWYFAFPSVIQGVGATFNIPLFQNYLANPVGMAILGLTFCYAAYMSEVYRAGIQSISKGQMEAARSLGMNYVQSMRFIILPQAVRVILPPVGNDFISLLKDSSLVSVVAVADLTRRGREFMAAKFIPIETWVMVALIYLVMTLFAGRIVHWIEKKTRLEH
ncbi:MAG: amino acid ABC transporter permease [Anaerolineaceae bacterium]|nr:amino acid ABC transporter permease [Anaerolineaceae bacterium]